MRSHAEKALTKMNGHGYDSLILSVSWSRELFRQEWPTKLTHGRTSRAPSCLVSQPVCIRQLYSLHTYDTPTCLLTQRVH
jgi:hypothetical protein